MSGNSSHRTPSDEDLDVVAASWVARRDHGLSEGERDAFADWLAKDERHALALRRCESTWAALPSLRQLPPEKMAELMAPRRRPNNKKTGSWFWIGATVTAAAAAIAIMIFRPIPPISVENGAIAFAAEGPDEMTRVTLPDGSAAELRSGTEILYQHDRSTRRIALVRGEAHFTVTKTTGDAFAVEAGRALVRDLGTAFDVRLDPEQVSVLVTEGRIAMQAKESSANGKSVAVGEEARMRGDDPEGKVLIYRPDEAEFAGRLAWRIPRLTFARTSLAEVISAFNRYNRRQLAAADPETAAVQVACSFSPTNFDAFLRLMETGFGVVAEPRADGTTVLRKKKE